MPKLIIKQDLVEVAPAQKYAKWLSLGGLLLLLAVTAFFLLQSLPQTAPQSSAMFPLPAMQSASDAEAKAVFIQQNNELEARSARFQALDSEVPGSQAQAKALLTEAEGILQHLFTMDDSVLALGLNDAELEAMQERQQYLQDVWQSRLHFSELRLGRMQDTAVADTEPVVVATPVAGDESQPVPVQDDSVALAPPAAGVEQKGSRFLAAPPPGMELPPGFCNLTGPDACKPEPDK